MIFGRCCSRIGEQGQGDQVSETRRITLQACVCVVTLLLFVSCGHTEQLDLSRLKLPEGFHVAVFATAPHARMLAFSPGGVLRSEEHTSELQSPYDLVCRLLLEKKNHALDRAETARSWPGPGPP